MMPCRLELIELGKSTSVIYSRGAVLGIRHLYCMLSVYHLKWWSRAGHQSVEDLWLAYVIYKRGAIPDICHLLYIFHLWKGSELVGLLKNHISDADILSNVYTVTLFYMFFM